MGVDTKNTNVEVSLEIIGILKRTLSQPANVKIILYRGIVEAAYANQNLVHPTLDLLLTHLTTLQEISRSAYAISILMRLSMFALRNTSTQVVSCRDAKVVEAKSAIDKLIEFCIDRDVHDLQLDKLADFSMSAAGRTNLCFASMINSLYDALIEHLWHVGYVLSKYHFILSVFYLKVVLEIVGLRS
ncbi:unnamed protein product [Gongylonema pulchrum]|uniref:Adaptin_N domain-containing protein n=1 Tax=Gongylonema pulchrum TaxID=637853 RepID=A0A183EXL0_9BILA|nr:unnamed protein product [Gongylonema pulchrum]